MFNNPAFWVAVPFAIFVWLTFKPVKKILIEFLDGRSTKIKNEIQQIDNIKKESLKILEMTKLRQRMVNKEIDELIANAEIEIKKMKENAADEVSSFLNKRTSQIMEKISMHESEIMQQLREEAIETTISIASTLIKQNMNPKLSAQFMSSTLANVSKKIH